MKSFPIITNVIFFETDYPQGPSVDVSPRPFSSLTIRRSGKISVTWGGKTFFSGKDTLTFIPHGCEYTTQVLEGGNMAILHFYTDDASPLFAPEPAVALPDFPLRFHNLFKNASTAFLSGGCDMLAMSSAYQILNEASQAFFSTPPTPPLRLIRTKEFIDENITDTQLNIPFLAKMCGVSEVHFRNEFKKHYGISPLSYIKKQRIETSCRLLSTGLYSITQVATLSGFESVSYFSSEFRRLKQCTPKEYKFK